VGETASTRLCGRGRPVSSSPVDEAALPAREEAEEATRRRAVTTLRQAGPRPLRARQFPAPRPATMIEGRRPRAVANRAAGRTTTRARPARSGLDFKHSDQASGTATRAGGEWKSPARRQICSRAADWGRLAPVFLLIRTNSLTGCADSLVPRFSLTTPSEPLKPSQPFAAVAIRRRDLLAPVGWRSMRARGCLPRGGPGSLARPRRSRMRFGSSRNFRVQ